jgi:hypothetical protein
MGHHVVAIDVPESTYGQARVYTVVLYDGCLIPLRPNGLSCVFTSNVLEHVQDLVGLGVEIGKVLSEDGYAVHLMPTASWRIWTLLTHYPHMLRLCTQEMRRKLSPCKAHTMQSRVGSASKKYGVLGVFRRFLMPSRHGEVGNTISEIYHFSRFRWRRFFRESGWQLVEVFPTRLFYTGYSLLDTRLSLRARHFLSYFLGSSCLVYVVRCQDSSAESTGESRL